jgi:DNA-binding transcriptional regulator LsrR (DeoR family)
MINEARNLEICRRYLTGQTQKDIATAMHISRARVSQVLSDADISKEDSPHRTNRDAFLGVELTADVKEAFRLEAERRSKSMSELASELIQNSLAAA